MRHSRASADAEQRQSCAGGPPAKPAHRALVVLHRRGAYYIQVFAVKTFKSLHKTQCDEAGQIEQCGRAATCVDKCDTSMSH